MHRLPLHYYDLALTSTPTTWNFFIIITKTYRLCQGAKFNGSTKSKFHRYPSPIIGKGCKWGVGALKDTQIWSHTIHLETNCWSFSCTSTVFGASYMSIGPQNGPTPHEHASQGFHTIMGKAQPIFVHFPTFIWGNYLSIWTFLSYE
jgi:hypothetical protein